MTYLRPTTAGTVVMVEATAEMVAAETVVAVTVAEVMTGIMGTMATAAGPWTQTTDLCPRALARILETATPTDVPATAPGPRAGVDVGYLWGSWAC